jgi:hypothetical protein
MENELAKEIVICCGRWIINGVAVTNWTCCVRVSL